MGVLQRLKEGRSRLCDGTLLALGLQPNVALTQFPEKGRLSQNGNYNQLSKEELTIGIFQSLSTFHSLSTPQAVPQKGFSAVEGA